MGDQSPTRQDTGGNENETKILEDSVGNEQGENGATNTKSELSKTVNAAEEKFILKEVAGGRANTPDYEFEDLHISMKAGEGHEGMN